MSPEAPSHVAEVKNLVICCSRILPSSRAKERQTTPTLPSPWSGGGVKETSRQPKKRADEIDLSPKILLFCARLMLLRY